MSKNWVVGTCWVCDSDKIRQSPDRRYVGESKYICLSCGNHMGTIKPLKVQSSASKVR